MATSGRLFLTLIMVFLISGEALSQSTSDRIAVLSDLHGYYPCMDCHGDQVPVATPRILEEEHAEPLVWEDEDGQIHTLAFGEKVAFADLLEAKIPGELRSEKLVTIGMNLGIRQYMDFNGFAPEDSVWTMIHGGGNIWCLNCHDLEDRDKLVKLNGELVTFNQSHLLCGECRGNILADWESGIHGKVEGFWDLGMDSEGESVKMLCVECHNPHAPAFASMTPLAPPISRLPQPVGKPQKHGEQAAGHEGSH